jgi:6-phosphogluconolactonase
VSEDTASAARATTAQSGREPAIPGIPARVVVLPDAAAIAREAAALTCERLGAAIADRGEAHLVLTGGSSAAALHSELAAHRRDAIDWSRVHLWWGDERFVPLDHPQSNAGAAFVLLLRIDAHSTASGMGAVATDVRAGITDALPVPAANVHPVPVDEAVARAADAGWAAARYEESIAALVPQAPSGGPAFDVVLLGVGPDGHILSVFPGSAALERDAPLVLPVPAPEHVAPHIPRVTMRPSILEDAGTVIVMVPGGGKADVVREVLGGDGDPGRSPARLAVRDRAVWLLDEESAAGLATKPLTPRPRGHGIGNVSG